MEELIAKMTRMKELDAELSQIAENRKAVRKLEDGYRKERTSVVAALRKLGISIARTRKPAPKKEKTPKKEKAAPTDHQPTPPASE